MRRRAVGPRFEVVERFRPFELVSPGFETVQADTTPGFQRSGWSPPAPFVAVEAVALSPVRLGIAAANGDHLLGYFADGSAGLEIRTGGVTTRLAERRVRGRVRRVAFVLCENQPTVLVETSRGWQPVVAEKHRVAPRLDLRRPATLGRFSVAWELGSGTARAKPGGAVDGDGIGAVRAGPFGMTGLRDLHLVQHADGAPYLDERGRLLFTATCAGLGFFQQAHWGVFALHPPRTSYGSEAIGAGTYDVPARLEQTAHLYFHRDGMLLGDHAGQLVRDGDRWLLAVSSWGDFDAARGTHTRHLTTTTDLLHGVHVLETEPTPLPTALATYDPGMTRIDGRWHVSFVASPSQRRFDFHPALAVGPKDAAHWVDGLELVGADTGLHHCEGPVLATLPTPDGEAWRLLASDGHARRYRVYDLAMRRLGDLDAPYGSNIPHPQVVQTVTGERLMVTFDGTQYGTRVLGYGAHGDVVIMREVG